MALYQPAAVVMVPAPEGMFRRGGQGWLTVTRPEPPHEAALPGGFIEPGETPEEAAIRELREETGVVADRLERVGLGGQDGRVVHVFLAKTWTGRPRSVEAKGRGGRVAWMIWSELRAQAARFGEFLDGLESGFIARYGRAP